MFVIPLTAQSLAVVGACQDTSWTK
ncbi:unnamed protein product [Podospora anserina S mat+]|uniref:Podospora anserina S mat+ genomic DNA chromosome 6, supercontig 2 n=2 Tax=Podospora TaxID=5144 RepID=B2B224_PODAN|nr:unnamed protein product [Podospora anserina S mat+]CDP30559.1 Putative protein of unknown function [Podospora anserina S mat+]